MQLIQNGTQAGTVPPAPAAASGTPGYASNALPGIGVTPTTWDPDVANALVGELAALVLGAGVTLSPGVFNQALAAAKRLAAGNVTSVTAAGATSLVVDSSGLVLANATAGSQALTLPAANGAGGTPITIQIVRVDGTGNGLTVQPAGTDVLDPGALAGSAAQLSIGAYGTVTLRSDGVSAWHILAATGARVMAVYGTAGTNNLTVPPGIARAHVRLAGGGGGGSVSSSATPGTTVNYSGAGGGAGGYAEGIVNVLPGQVIPVTVGAAGAEQATGGGSSFGAFMSATGGGGASFTSAGQSAGAAGGTASGGAINIGGGSGGDGQAGAQAQPGNGAASYFGGGGRGADGGGQSAQVAGAGGGGAYASASGPGGAGAAGIVIVEMMP